MLELTTFEGSPFHIFTTRMKKKYLASLVIKRKYTPYQLNQSVYKCEARCTILSSGKGIIDDDDDDKLKYV